MKQMNRLRTLSLAIAGMLAGSLAFAQDQGRAFYQQPYKTRNSGSFSSDASILSIGLGAPNNNRVGKGWNGGNRIGFPPTYVKYEHGIIDEVGIGGYLAFSASRYKWDNDFYHARTAFGFGVLGYYHFNRLIPVSQLDVYAGAGLGFRVVNDIHERPNDRHRDSDFDPLPLFKAGARWYFTPKFAVYLEGGYDGMSDVNLGITLRF